MMEATPGQHLLEKGIAAARAGLRAEARQYLLEVIGRDPLNLEAWLWLGGVAEDPGAARDYLSRALEINPTSHRAQQGLAWAQQWLAESAPGQGSGIPSAEALRWLELPETVAEASDQGVASSPASPFAIPSPVKGVDSPPDGQTLGASIEALLRELEAGPAVPVSEAPGEAPLAPASPPLPSRGEPSSEWQQILEEFTEAAAPPEPVLSETGPILEIDPAVLQTPAAPASPGAASAVVEETTEEPPAGVAAAPGAEVPALLKAARELLEEERYQELLEQLAPLVEMHPEIPEAYELVGVAHYRRGNREEARRAWERVAALRPDRAEAHANLGTLWSEEGRWEDAEAAFGRCLRLKGDLAEARAGLAEVLMQQQRYSEALEEWRQAAALRPDVAQVRAGLAGALTLQGQPQVALKELQAAVALEPDQAQNRLRLGELLTQLQHYDEALRQFQAALKLDSSLAKAHLGISRVFRSQGRRKEAEDALSRALALAPDFPEAATEVLRLRGKASATAPGARPAGVVGRLLARLGLWRGER